MTVEPVIVSVEQLGLRVRNPKLVASPRLNQVVKRSCHNCGWKLKKKPTVVMLYGIERVDNKVRVNGNKWCVNYPKRPVGGVCSGWTERVKP